MTECEFCGDIFKSKKEYIRHLNMELEMVNETVLNAQDDALQIETILEELEKAKPKVVKK